MTHAMMMNAVLTMLDEGYPLSEIAETFSANVWGGRDNWTVADIEALDGPVTTL